MRSDQYLLPHVAAAAFAFVLVASIFLSPRFAWAGDGEAAASAPASPGRLVELSPSPSRLMAGLDSLLDANDEIAALESVQLALSQVGDGSTYIWHRYHGRLSGVVQPTSSFKDRDGRVCRHLVVSLTATDHYKAMEGIACRTEDGIWQLEG